MSTAITVNAPCAGTILSISASPGGIAEAGTELLIIESMKMEIPVEAPRDGRIETVFVEVGTKVAEHDPLVLLL